MKKIKSKTRKEISWAELKQLVKDNWEQMKETDRRMQETDRQMQETDRRMKETDRQMQETDRRLQETERLINKNGVQLEKTKIMVHEVVRGINELKESRRKTDERIRELADQFTSTTGHITEGIMHPAAIRVFQEAGYNINRYYRNLKRKNKQKQTEMEVDLLMLDDTLVIAVEIKTDCRKKDIDHFLRQMPKFKRLFPEYRDKEVLAAMAALNYDKDAAQYAYEQGLLVISTTDGNIFTLEPSDRETLKRFREVKGEKMPSTHFFRSFWEKFCKMRKQEIGIGKVGCR